VRPWLAVLDSARGFRSALFVIVAASLALRLVGIDFGLPAQTHPDEPQVVAVAVNAADGLMAPSFMGYGSVFPYISGALLRIWTTLTWDSFRDFFDAYCVAPGEATVVIRVVSAFFGAATVALTGLLGRRLVGPRIGLAAAAVLAVDLLAVRDAHFATVDTALSCFAVGALLAMAHRRWVLSAVLVGLAMGTKLPGALLVVPLALSMPRKLPLALPVIAAVFLATNPYILVEWEAFRADLDVMSRRAAELQAAEFPAPPWIYYPTVALPYALSWLGVLALLVGFSKMRRSLVPALAFVAVMGAFVCTFTGSFDRYLLPIHPVLALLIALGASRLPWAGVPLVLLPMAWQSVRLDRSLLLPDTRNVAAEWLESSLEPGARVAVEWAYAPTLDPERFELVSYSYQPEPGVVVLSSYAFNRYRMNPGSYAQELAAIEALGEPDQVFSGLPAERAWDYVERVPPGPLDQSGMQGPEIRIYLDGHPD